MPPANSLRPRVWVRVALFLVGFIVVPVVVAIVLILIRPSSSVSRPTPTWTWTSGPSATRASPRDVPSVIPGWAVAYSAQDLAAYDYPATSDWEFRPGVITGYETSQRILVLRHAVTTYRAGGCEVAKGRRAEVGFVTSQGQDPDGAQVADNLAVRWAEARDTEDNGQVHGVPDPVRRTVLSADGKTTISVSSVTFSPVTSSKTECAHPSMRFTAAYKKGANGTSLVLVISSDQGVAGSLGLDVEDSIISSMRDA